VTNRKEPDLEVGAVETAMREEPVSIAPVEPEQVDSVPHYPQVADLTGQEMAEIRARADSVDEALKRAQAAQAEALHTAKMHQFAQEALSALIGQIIRSRDLDPSLRFRVDLDTARVVPVGPAAPSLVR
jgi:hypothetical protein